MKNKTVLVTGSLGFIGSHVLSHFSYNGWKAFGWDIADKDNTKYVDLSKKESIIEEIIKIEPDVIVHCAGNANVNSSVVDPEMDYNKNVVITKNLLDSLPSLKSKPRIVFLSSAAVYGNQDVLPICEDAPLNPLSPYAKHKIMCEDMCTSLNRDGYDVKIARIFSVYGNGLKKQIFWDMHNKIKETNKLEMFGTGNESRDYIHVNDLLNVLYILATADTDEVIFNVANGEEVYIKDVAKMFAKINGIEEVYFNGVEMKGNPINWRADISKIKKLGYKQGVSLYEGINSYSNWVKANE